MFSPESIWFIKDKVKVKSGLEKVTKLLDRLKRSSQSYRWGLIEVNRSHKSPAPFPYLHLFRVLGEQEGNWSPHSQDKQINGAIHQLLLYEAGRKGRWERMCYCIHSPINPPFLNTKEREAIWLKEMAKVDENLSNKYCYFKSN